MQYILFWDLLSRLPKWFSMDKSIFTPEQIRLQELLRQIRLGAGLRQQDLATKLEQPQSFVSKYEAGERRLDLLEIRAICAAVGISLREFVDRLESTFP